MWHKCKVSSLVKKTFTCTHVGFEVHSNARYHYKALKTISERTTTRLQQAALNTALAGSLLQFCQAENFLNERQTTTRRTNNGNIFLYVALSLYYRCFIRSRLASDAANSLAKNGISHLLQAANLMLARYLQR